MHDKSFVKMFVDGDQFSVCNILSRHVEIRLAWGMLAHCECNVNSGKKNKLQMSKMPMEIVNG